MDIQPKCILWGGYSFGNTGDELTLASAIRDMRQRFGASIAILTSAPGYTRALFPNEHLLAYTPLASRPPSPPSIAKRVLRKLGRPFGYKTPQWLRFSVENQLKANPVAEWLSALRDASMVYYVGGGYLSDLFDLDHFLFPGECAQQFGTRIETAPLGIGPFRSDLTAQRVRDVFRKSLLRVRDEDSLIQCARWGIAAEKSVDDGFRVREVVDFSPVRRRRDTLGVNYFEQTGSAKQYEIRCWWREFLREILREGIKLEGFCFHNAVTSDFSMTVELLNEVGLTPSETRPPDMDFRSACQRIVSYGAVVTSRFHAAVVANAMDVPVLAIANGFYYKSKMTAAVGDSAHALMVEPGVMPVRQAVSRVSSWLSGR